MNLRDPGSAVEKAADKPGDASTSVIRFTVNRRTHDVQADRASRLSDVLRDELGLTGTKIGCHAGDCGACTVLLDGEQVCSCIVAVGQCEGRAITTVEGLAGPGGELSALQKAFVSHGAAQCGICTPGMLMSAESLLRANPHPSEAEVLDALGGVLCRCTGYRKIVEAVLAVAAGHVEPLEAPAAGHAVGARLARLDAPAKVLGDEKFGADEWPHAHQNGLAMRVLRSPHPHARFVLGDFGALKAQWPGLVDVVTAADVPNNAFAIFANLRDQPVLADAVARFRGEAVLALVGDAQTVQAIADRDVPVEWTVLEAFTDSPDALAAAEKGEAIHARYPDNVLCRGRVVRGSPEQALAQSALVASANFDTAYVEHAYIEPEAGYAEVVQSATAEGKQLQRLRIFACTQTPYMDRDEIAHITGLAQEQVHIVPSAIGGGFGGKLDLSVQPLLAVAALKLNRPVRLVYDRPESMRSSTKRHPARMSARMGCDAQGRLSAYDFEGDFNTGAYSSWGPTVANRVPIHASGPYRFDHVRALTRAVHTHNSVAGAFRGFGVPQSTLLNETLIDELAARCAIDALEFRHHNALRAGDTTPTGQVLHASVGLQACLDALRPAWRAAKQTALVHNTKATLIGSPIRRGVGVACMWYGIGNTVIANPSTMRGSLRCDAERGAHLFLYNGAQEIGQGSATIMPQMFADAVGLPVACVEQLMGDTDLTADAGKSSASRQTFVSGNAVRGAGHELRAKLLAQLGLANSPAAPVRLELTGHTLHATQSGRRASLDLRTLPADAHGDLFTGSGYFDPPTVPLDADGQGVPYATYGFAAQIAELEVDTELGTVKLLHIHAAHDVGRAINPTQVEGQVHGGIAQGIGLALMEEYINGQTDNLHDYLIPTVGDVPPITVHLVEDPEPLGPWGAKGVGEPALVATAPAILNAIHDAVGVRMKAVPVTPAKLREAMLRPR
jgi:aldehyde oxidoreductase